MALHLNLKEKFKLEGDTRKKIDDLLKEAKLIEKCRSICRSLRVYYPQNASKIITNNLNIPTIGIGSSASCDGQILVTDDMLGLSGFYPKFVKKYLSLDRLIDKSS